MVGKPGEMEPKVPREVQEQPEEREAVDKSSVKCSLLHVIWHGNLLKRYFRKQVFLSIALWPGKGLGFSIIDICSC